MDLANQHIIDVLNEHKNSYDRARDFASQTKQPVPTHTVNWSQILISKVSNKRRMNYIIPVLIVLR